MVVVVGGEDGRQGGVGGVCSDRAGAGWGAQGGEFAGVGGEGGVGAERFVVEGLAGGADGDGGAFASGGTPGADRLGEQVECGQEDQDSAAGGDAGGGAGGDQGFARPAGGDHARAGAGAGAERGGSGGDGFFLVGP